MTDLPYQAEYAKTGRASCKGCKTQIPKDAVRLAIMVQSAFFDGKQANWFHEKCFFLKQRPQSIDEFSNINSLRAVDQKRIKEAIEKVGSGIVLPPADNGKPKKGKGTKRSNDDSKALAAALKDFAVEYSKSSRATCRGCEIKICKGEVRVCKVVYDTEIGQKYGGQALWYHVKCFAEDRSNLMYWASGELLPGFKSLKADDKEIVKKEIPDKPLDEVPVKKLKAEPKDQAELKQDKELEKKMDVQNKLFFKYRDGLQKSGLRKAEFHEMLEFNQQEIPSGIEKCLDILADSMAFGTLKPCSECKKGQLHLNTSGYVCTGNLTEWTKCQNITQKPERFQFKVPPDYKDLPVFRRFKPKVTERIFASAPKPSTSFIKTEPELTKVKPEKPAPPLKNLKFFIYGRNAKNKEELKHKILKLGGLAPSKLNDSVIAVVSTQDDVDKMSDKMREIEKMEIPVVTDEYIAEVEKEKNGTVKHNVDLIMQHNIADWGKDPSQKLPQDVLDGKSIPKSGSMYVKSEKSGVKKLKVKGGSAVDPDSNLEDVAHVYIDKNGPKWTVVLGLTDIVAQKNSFYKLQLLEGDSQHKYWLFRSWGRIGTTIGGNKLDSCSSIFEAKRMFQDLYFDKTANKWDDADNFTKVPGKMHPIEVDYQDAGEEEMKLESCKESKLPMPVQSLVQLMFDIKLMKQVLLEFELDTEKMPLGKLSKKQITSGYKVLKEVIKLLEDARKKNKNPDQNRIIDATNRFYTLIPHDFGVQNPPLMDNTEMITSKTQMLDSLLEIEIAYSLMKTESDEKLSPIEAHYMKLKTEIVPMDKKSPEYELLTKYVHNTHAKTHSQYTLTINQIFKVVREGEEKRYKPFKKLHNRRLLWHGSRVTNFVGILSQGLRIAPPEAPVTGYMFGKGIYFADMVSKSANYCYTHVNSPTGVMLLCEVALGNMEECLHATSFSKAPPGKHSVWGMGRTEPDPSQNHVMDDGLIVPMGTPVDKSLSSSLLYNEFIIYDVAQVNVKYLFEMKFGYKY